VLLLAGIPGLAAALWLGVNSVTANALLLESMEPGRANPISPAVRSVQIYPHSHQALDHLARLYAASGQYDKALEESRIALRYREAFRTREFRQDVYLALGRTREAAEEGDRALRLNPMYPPLVIGQARLRKSAGLPCDDLLDRADLLLRGLLAEGKAAEAAWTARGITELDPDRADTVRQIQKEAAEM
jgi:tetratricopeptide (TPR) repeat protein